MARRADSEKVIAGAGILSAATQKRGVAAPVASREIGHALPEKNITGCNSLRALCSAELDKLSVKKVFPYFAR